jgi:hypothetical protein
MNTCVYVLETIKMIPGKKADYLQAVEREYLPMVKKHGVRLFAFWGTWDQQGDSLEARAMWEFDNWAHVRRFTQARYAKGHVHEDIRGWDEKVWTWIAHKEAVCMTPSLGARPLQTLLSHGFRAPIVWMGNYTKMVSGKRRQLLEAWEVQQMPIMKADPIGFYMGCSTLTSHEMISLWKWDGWDNLDLFDRMPPYPHEPLPMLREMMNWGEIAFSLRTHWADKLLCAVPFSPIR